MGVQWAQPQDPPRGLSSSDYAAWQRGEAAKAMERLDAMAAGEGVGSYFQEVTAVNLRNKLLSQSRSAVPEEFEPVDPEPLGVGERIGAMGVVGTFGGVGYGIGSSAVPAHAAMLEALGYGAGGAVVFGAGAAVALRRLIRNR